MGGSVGKEVGKKVTHVIAKTSMGDKYNYATTFSIPVLTEDWLQAAWDNRENIGYRASTKENHEKYKLPPFAGNVICFYVFMIKKDNKSGYPFVLREKIPDKALN